MHTTLIMTHRVAFATTFLASAASLPVTLTAGPLPGSICLATVVVAGLISALTFPKAYALEKLVSLRTLSARRDNRS